MIPAPRRSREQIAGDGDQGGGGPGAPTPDSAIPESGTEPLDEPAGVLTLEPGNRLAGRYLLQQKLATGVASSVWRGRDEDLDRSVAIKVLHVPESLDPEVVELFRREARTVAQLQHPNIVRLYDVGVDRQLHYLVMEEVGGCPLAEALEHARPSADSLAGLAAQAAEALAATHRADLAHRDVKPSNMLLSRQGTVKLTDFGIVRDLQSGSTIREKGTLLGTARYLAPEQIEGEAATPASDVYSLGLVLWESWAGEPAFEGDTDAATALARLDRQPPPPSSIRPGLPRRLDEMVATATARDPAGRYPDGASLREALRGLLPADPEQAVRALLPPDTGQGPPVR